MSNSISPFHYEIRFRLLAFDKENNTTNQTHIKPFNNGAPLENRKEAFDEFDEYVSYIDKSGRLERDKNGNYQIAQPSFISEILEDRFKDPAYEEQFEFYKEEITIFLVITDEVLSDWIHGPKSTHDPDPDRNSWVAFLKLNKERSMEFEIHKMASYNLEMDKQKIIDNLDFVEVDIYKHLNIDIEHLLETVYHYGEDFDESGEDEESGAKRTILPTPYVWDTYEGYLDAIESITKNVEEDNEGNETNTKENNFNSEKKTFKLTEDKEKKWKDIINKGESNTLEFKPALVYNFKTQSGGIGVKNIIAKAICGFLNSNGGVVVIGVSDSGKIQGLEESDFLLFEEEKKHDEVLKELDHLIVFFFNKTINPLINSSFDKIDGKHILIVSVTESAKPVFLRNNKTDQEEKEFYIRMNASTRQITDVEEIVGYILNKVPPREI